MLPEGLVEAVMHTAFDVSDSVVDNINSEMERFMKIKEDHDKKREEKFFLEYQAQQRHYESLLQGSETQQQQQSAMTLEQFEQLQQQKQQPPTPLHPDFTQFAFPSADWRQGMTAPPWPADQRVS
eukprot:gnl/Hemi2/1751_TR618_c0_g10_i1.p1 gnl/Hemi2/1751_TR618_c0_g10~~gnl/Hemi2/1751_TR618_c0_g10_i1.p1  ORF type:complete len:125 (-),score=31.73 gnl/Hemi2/1751_TR618_c0_g10_i1:53-427(-)